MIEKTDYTHRQREEIIDRLFAAFNDLIDYTDDRVVARNRRANERLRDALKLIEHVVNDEESPLSDWFDDL